MFDSAFQVEYKSWSQVPAKSVNPEISSSLDVPVSKVKMRSAILFGLIVCLAFSLVLPLEESINQSNDLSSVEKDIGQAVESDVRAKRQFGFGGPFGGFGGPFGGYGGYGGLGGFGYGRPFYGGYGRPFYGGFGRPFYGGGFGGPFFG